MTTLLSAMAKCLSPQQQSLLAVYLISQDNSACIGVDQASGANGSFSNAFNACNVQITAFTYKNTHLTAQDDPGEVVTDRKTNVNVILKQDTVSGSGITPASVSHMQICTSPQTDNHANAPPLRLFLQAGCFGALTLDTTG